MTGKNGRQPFSASSFVFLCGAFFFAALKQRLDQFRVRLGSGHVTQTGVRSCDPGLGLSALIWAPRHQLTHLSSLIRLFVSAGARDDQLGRRQKTVVTVIAPATGLTADSVGMDTALMRA